MKTLQIIQTISKIGRIVSKVIFVCCIVGFCLCIVGIAGLAIGSPALRLGDVTLEGILQQEANTTTGTLYTTMAIYAIVCAAQAVLAKFADRYFTRELADGTPFTLDGAKELLRLGILSVCIPVGTQIVVQIVQTILVRALTDVDAQTPEMAGSVTLGVMVIVAALLCRYGAELLRENASPAAEENGAPPQAQDYPDT